VNAQAAAPEYDDQRAQPPPRTVFTATRTTTSDAPAVVALRRRRRRRKCRLSTNECSPRPRPRSRLTTARTLGDSVRALAVRHERASALRPTGRSLPTPSRSGVETAARPRKEKPRAPRPHGWRAAPSDNDEQRGRAAPPHELDSESLTAAFHGWGSAVRADFAPADAWSSSAAGAPRTWTQALASGRMRARERGVVSSPGPVEARPNQRAASGESRD
jgi:hypothetical protein